MPWRLARPTAPPSMEHPESKYVVIGKITSAYGIKGWVKIYSYTDPVSNILNYPVWYLSSGTDPLHWREIAVIQGRPQGKFIVAQLAGINDRNQAELLHGTEIAIPRDQLPAAADGEYYWLDLLGLKVVNIQGIELGVISDIMETGANDVLVVQGERQRLIPYVMDEIIKQIDLQAGTLRVDWEADY